MRLDKSLAPLFLEQEMRFKDDNPIKMEVKEEIVFSFHGNNAEKAKKSIQNIITIYEKIKCLKKSSN